MVVVVVVVEGGGVDGHGEEKIGESLIRKGKAVVKQ